MHDIVEAHCYFVDIGRTDREQIRSRIIVIDSATYLLTISLPDVNACLSNASPVLLWWDGWP